MPKSPKGKARSKSATPVPPKPQAAGKPIRKPRRKQEKRRAAQAAASAAGSGAATPVDAGADFIDLTGFDDGSSDDDAAAESGAGSSLGSVDASARATPVKRNGPGDSLFRSLLGKGKQRAEGAAPSPSSVSGTATPVPSTPAPRHPPSSFTPLSRSVISGLNTPLSPSPPPRVVEIEEGEVDGFEDGEIRADEPATGAPASDFEPPALFGSALGPAGIVGGGPAGAQLQLAKPDVDGDKGELLLPAHVVRGETEDIDGDESMEGVHVVDDDRAKGVPRYFIPPEPETEEAAFLANADQRQICRNCKRSGHKEAECPHVICMTCGKEDDHERRDCPMSMVCFGCGQRGHRKASRKTCTRCGIWDHTENTCPLIWRVYAFLSSRKRRDVQDDRATAQGWEREAVGGGEADRWCYNCAQEGHFGDECQNRRGSLGRPVTNSAFSHHTASRGPFSSASGSRRGHPSSTSGTHTRFDEDDAGAAPGLPHVAPGFQGAGAGRKTRDKQREAARRAGGGSGDEDDAWVRPDRAPRSEGRLPFGHAHFLGRQGGAGGSAPPKPIAVGRLAMPSTPGGDSPAPSPLAGRGISVRGRGGAGPYGRQDGSPRGGGALVRLGRGGSAGARGNELPPRPSPLGGRGEASAGRRKRDGEGDRDWEAEWRRGGRGGGNVAGWGREMDREERDAKRREGRGGGAADDERVRAGPVRGGAGTPRGGRGGAAGASARGTQKGQKYLGGY